MMRFCVLARWRSLLLVAALWRACAFPALRAFLAFPITNLSAGEGDVGGR